VFDHLDDGNPPQPGPLDRARVRSRADDLVRHRRLMAGLAVAVVLALLAAIPGVFTATGGDSKRVQTASAPATTSSTSVEEPGVVNPVATPLDSTTTPAFAAPPGTRPATTTTTNGRPSSTTTTIVCRNSYDPACGEFRWDPPVQDQGATMTITWTPSQPKAGEKVTFRVVIDDPDDPSPKYNLKQEDYGEAGGQFDEGDPSQNTCENRYGPWTPPPPGPGHYEQDGGYGLEYTFKGAGAHPIMIGYTSGGPNWCYDPYNQGTVGGKATVTVSP
jgi:hypothetical protein